MYIKKKKHSRSFVLMSVTPSRRFCLCSAILLAQAKLCVAGNYRPRVGMILNKIVGFRYDQCS